MRRAWICGIQIALSLLMVIGLATGCTVPSSTSAPGSAPAPSASEYPADILGHVTITEKVLAKYDRNKPDTMELTPLEGKVFWIVDISVKNRSYHDVVTAISKDWKIITGDKVYDAQRPFMDISASTAMSVPVGATGETTFRFPVPDTLKVSSAKLCYQGQEPYSYGELIGGDIVAAYDWDSKTVIEEQEIGKYEQYFVKREVTEHRKVGKIGDIDITEPVYEDIYMKLKTVGHWEKGTSGEPTPSFGMEGQPTGFYWLIGFHISQAPWVVNWGYESREFTALDPLGSEATFSVSIFSKADFEKYFYSSGDQFMLSFRHVGEYRGASDTGVHCTVVQEKGHYVIVLKTKDVKDIVDWWLKLGVE